MSARLLWLVPEREGGIAGYSRKLWPEVARAAASEGEANAALVRFIAATLRVAPREVSLLAGARARLKRVRVGGEAASLATALEKICAIG